jgi:hypothetical protein
LVKGVGGLILLIENLLSCFFPPTTRRFGRCGATSAPPIINLITEMEILALGFDRTGKFV